MSDFHPRHHVALARLVNERDRYRLAVEAFTEEVSDAAKDFAARGRGGQHVPFHGDFANVAPSVMGRLKWWVKHMAGGR